MAEAHKRAYRYPKYKTSYHVKNWQVYEKSLRNRGDITFWLSRDAINAWTPPKNEKRGGQPIYSEIAIETSLTLRLVFHLPLRQAEGFLKSIHSKTNGFVSALPRSHDSIPPESNVKRQQMYRELVGRPGALYCKQHRFEDLRPGRMALQEAWGKAAQTLEETPPWCG